LNTFKLNKEIIKINRVIGNITSTLKIVKGLNYKLNVGVDNSNGTRDVQILPFAAEPGRLETYYTTNQNFQVENYFTYNLKTGDHNISALAVILTKKYSCKTAIIASTVFPLHL
jgi:iron complex outermembrane receptor protein